MRQEGLNGVDYLDRLFKIFFIQMWRDWFNTEYNFTGLQIAGLWPARTAIEGDDECWEVAFASLFVELVDEQV